MWFNSFVRWLLYSRLHLLISKNVMLVTYTGCKSGNTYTTPVNYMQHGDTFYTTSLRTRTWWRNLRGKVPIELRVQGRDLLACAEVVEDEATVANELSAYFGRFPQLARLYSVKQDSRGSLDARDLLENARKMVMVKSTLHVGPG